MDWESDQLLRKMTRLTEQIRHHLDKVIDLTAEMNEAIKNLAVLHPEFAIMLVAESVLLSGVGAAPASDMPRATLGISMPDGIGLCVWKGTARTNDGIGMHFMPLERTPPVLLRLLVPHLESLLDSLRQRIES